MVRCWPRSEREAHERGQFRVKDLRDPRSGALGLVLEHEMRSPRHIRCPFRLAGERAEASL